MTAEFITGSVVDGISHRHPKDSVKDRSVPPISNLQIVSVCAEHQDQTLSMMNTSSFFDLDEETGELRQNRGYLIYPIANPTPAECLYTFLTQFKGGPHGYPCGCKSFLCIDEKGEARHLEHPKYPSKKCKQHKSDSISMERAALDFTASQAAMAAS
jgi:hypothetical protein